MAFNGKFHTDLSLKLGENAENFRGMSVISILKANF